MSQDRRTFLKRAAGAVPAAAMVGSLGLEGCDAAVGSGAEEGRELDRDLIDALAQATLPTEALSAEGTRAATGQFLEWLDGFEAGAELDHPYLNDRIRYGPPDPAPRWSRQLAELDQAAMRGRERSFAELSIEDRQELVADAIGEAGGLRSAPARAEHVALGLLAWFYASSQANDLCYGRQVLRQECRGIETLPLEPTPVEAEG